MKYEIEKTAEFDKWLKRLKDIQGKARILKRIKKIKEEGHFGDHKQLSETLFELRCFFGAGYRVYYTLRGEKVILIINAGDKDNQSEDIEKAQKILNELEE